MREAVIGTPIEIRIGTAFPSYSRAHRNDIPS